MLKRNNYFQMKLRESREEIERLKKEIEKLKLIKEK